jgi:hypothetical protein
MARDGNDSNGTSSAGAVEGEQYCMPSFQKRNVDSMTQAMGYHNMSDLANTPKPPTEMSNKPGVRRNMQENPALPNPGHNDRSE